MEIKLAGFNVDRDALDNLRGILANENLSENERITALKIASDLTPETICASYARISRDARVISELRKDARKDVEGSRKSNKAIIFTMGHKSIAEHARFNFDIVGISRRAVEAIEQNRLDSYTEKSQRYITMDGDIVIPKEIMETPFESRFLELIEKQNGFYKKNLERITNWHHNQDYSEMYLTIGAKDEEKQKGAREGLGKEDARYSLSLATQVQLGMTISARTLETLITRLRSSDSEELKEIGEQIFSEVEGVAPSVIKYTQPIDYFARTRSELEQVVSELIKKYEPKRLFIDCGRVKLFTKLQRDDSIIAGLVFSSSELSYDKCLQLVRCMKKEDKFAILDKTIEYQEKHNPMLREYELGDRVAEMVMSSSAFAQIKRHRMNTLIPQRYFSALGLTIPKSISAVGLEEELKDVVKESVRLYDDLLKEGYSRYVAECALTNSNRRRALFDANNRQVHAFCAERENPAAQWDIRKTANMYHALIQKTSGSQFTTRALCGKHEFDKVKRGLLEN